MILTESHESKQENFPGYKEIQTKASRHGIHILYNHTIELVKWKEILTGRRIDLTIKYNNIKYKISAIYGSASGDPNIMKSLVTNNKCQMIIGDFNIVLNDTDKSSPLDKRLHRTRTILQNHLNKNNLLDIGEALKNHKHTFYREGYSSRIDRIYISDKLIKQVNKFTVINTSSLFDHLGILVSINCKKERKFSYWKLNNTMINNKYFGEKIEKIINQCFSKEQSKNPVENWEINKTNVIKKIKQLQRFFQHKKKKKLKKLKDHQKYIESHDPNNSKKLNSIRNLLTKINDEINTIKRSKSLIRSEKLRDETISKIQTNFINKINKSKNPESKCSIEDQETYYKNIFNQNSEVDQQVFSKMINLWNQKFSDIEKEQLNRPITIKEIKDFLKTRPSNSTPGPDGISYLFYKKYKQILIKPLCTMMNYLLNGGEMASSMKTSFTVPLYKNKGDKDKPENWRPIALSNIDSKIYTGILNERLLKIVPSVISKYQTGFTKGRFIIENIIAIDEIIRFNPPKYVILCLDIAKAFDSINHDAIFRILEHINCGNFVNAIKQLYKQTATKIIFQGKISNEVPITNGVRQGDCLSPVLFNLGIEIMTKSIQKYNIGIKLHGVTLKILQYADDTTILCGSELDTNNTMQVLNNCKKVLNLQTNYEKSIGIKKSMKLPSSIKEAVGNERVLGYYFNKKLFNNFNNILQDLIERGKKWKNFNTNIKCKATIWNTFILSKIWYWIWGLNPTTRQISQLRNIQNWFVFHNESHYEEDRKYVMRMNKNRANREMSEGGLNLWYYKDRINAQKINLIERSMKQKGIMSDIIHSVLKTGSIKRNTQLGTNIFKYIKFFKKNRELLKENEIVSTRAIYNALISKKNEKSNLTENQLEYQKILRFPFPNIWSIIQNIKASNKIRFFLWRYFSNLLPIPRKKPCVICGQMLRKKHILFQCIPLLKKLKGLTTLDFKLDLRKWTEKEIIIKLLRNCYFENRIDWKKERIKLAILNRIWWAFTEIQYGGRKKESMFTNIHETFQEYVTESVNTYRELKSKKKRPEKKIIEINDQIPNDSKILLSNDQFILLTSKFTQQNLKTKATKNK